MMVHGRDQGVAPWASAKRSQPQERALFAEVSPPPAARSVAERIAGFAAAVAVPPSAMDREHPGLF